MSIFGRALRISTFGESHGAAVGVVIDGYPPNVKVDLEKDIQPQLTRRRPGQSIITTSRNEKDKVFVLSGLTDEGMSLGSPICLLVYNEDQRKYDYANVSQFPRPGHGEFTYMLKYGITAKSGGGRASARETIARVAGGALCEKYLFEKFNTKIVAWVSQIGPHSIDDDKLLKNTHITREIVDSIGSVDLSGEIVNTRIPDEIVAKSAAELINELRGENDSIGGVISCIIYNCPPGLGEPCFDKIEASLAHAMLSLPATKGFEIGEGFKSAYMKGSEHNDRFISKTKDDVNCNLLNSEQNIQPSTNHAGGTLAGISTGEDIYFRVAIKPASSIARPQTTTCYDGTRVEDIEIQGRHDPCVLPRAPPLVEGMAALVILDHVLLQNSRVGL